MRQNLEIECKAIFIEKDTISSKPLSRP